MERIKQKCCRIGFSQRLALRFSVMLAAFILALALTLVFVARYRVRSRKVFELRHTLEKIADIYMGGNLESRLPGTEPVPGFRRPPESGEVPYYILFTVYASAAHGGAAGSALPAAAIVETNDPFLPQLPLTDGSPRRYRIRGFFTDGDLDVLYCAKDYGIYTVQVAMNMDQDGNERRMAGIPMVILWSLVPLLILSYAAAYLITRGTMKPVERMTLSAMHIGSESLDQRLPLTGRGDELDVLAETFNRLFSRLKSDFDRERQFTSDVSHELKTPLAVILGHANLIRRWGKSDPVQLEKSLGMLITEVHSMESVIDNLLELSRLENGRKPAVLAPVRLTQLFSRLVEDTNSWAPEIVFTDKSDMAACVMADRELLYQACTIVVSNSVKFAGPRAHITFETRSGLDMVEIVLADDGPGIAPDVLPHVFERFYRGDAAHNRARGGSGLGLAIVKSIMTAMGGTVRAESPVQDGRSGTAIVFTLPDGSRF